MSSQQCSRSFPGILVWSILPSPFLLFSSLLVVPFSGPENGPEIAEQKVSNDCAWGRCLAKFELLQHFVFAFASSCIHFLFFWLTDAAALGREGGDFRGSFFGAGIWPDFCAHVYSQAQNPVHIVAPISGPEPCSEVVPFFVFGLHFFAGSFLMLQVGSKIGAALWHQFRGRRKRAPRTVIGHLFVGTFWAIFRHSKLTLANEMLCSPPGAREEQVHRTVLVIVAAWPCLFLAIWGLQISIGPLSKMKKCRSPLRVHFGQF